jgi:glycerol kinase
VVPNFPRTGWVELDPVALWRAQRDSMEAAMRKVGATTDDIAAIGLTLETGKAHVMRAGLEAMAYQTRDNVEALKAGGLSIPELKVDGGAARNNLLCQFQSS